MSIRQWLRKPFVSTPHAQEVDLSGTRAIVTGASAQSLGYATARILASWGASVCITTRHNTADTVNTLRDEYAEGKIHGHDLDLCDRNSVKQFADWYLKEHDDRLDFLINNAGIHLDLMSQWKQPNLTADEIEIHWRTNYLGTAQLTHLLLPLLRETGRREGQARVVNVSSQLHSRGCNDDLFGLQRPYNSWQAYGNSKLGLHHFTTELQRRYASSDNLKSYCLHPGGSGGTSTGVAGKGLEGHRLLLLLLRLGAPLQRLMMATPEEGAQTQIYCATAPTAEGGQYYRDCSVSRASNDSYDPVVARRLWEETLQWLNS